MRIGRDYSQETLRNFLRKIEIFSHLSDSEMESVARTFRERHYGRDEIIFAFHETGEHFGEMALLDGETAPANVTALVSTTILFINSRGFATLLYNPQVNQALFKILSKRCRDA